MIRLTRLSAVLLISLAVSVLGTLIIFPRIASAYYQARGGSLLRHSLDSMATDQQDIILCNPLAAMDKSHARSLQLARQQLDRARELNPAASHAYLLSGRVECLLGHPDRAIEYFLAYRELRPENPLANLHVGFALEAAGHDEAALDYWRSDRIIANNFLEAGEEARLANQPVEALAWYRRAMATRSGWNRPWYQSNLVYQELGQPDLALQALLEGIAQTNEKVGLSNLYYQVGWIKQYRIEPPDTTGAWDAYASALSFDDYSFSEAQKAATYLNRGVLLAWQGQIDEAISEYETSLELNPSLYWSHLGLARALWQKGQTNEARQLAEQATSLAPSPFDAYLTLGDFSRAQGDLVQARIMYEKALEINPDFENARDALEALLAER